MNDPRNLGDIIRLFLEIINMLLPIVVALALLVFFKGLAAFIYKAGDEKTHSEGRALMVWGLIALFVMISVYGIIQFFFADLGFRNPHSPNILPLLPGGNSI